MAEEQAETAEGEGNGNARQKLKTIVLIAIGAIVIASISIAGTWFLLGAGGAEDSEEMARVANDGEGDMEPSGPAIYLAMQPPFIVNYNTGARTRFLQLELSLVSRDGAAIDTANEHMPLIRNNLLEVLSRQDFEALKTIEGKQQLVDELTASVQAVMEDKLGRPGIETVLFRSFVMQ